MKKIIIALLAILPSISFAQNDFFDKFENKDGIEGVVITDNMLEVLGYIKISGAGDEEESLADNIKTLDNIKAFATSKEKRVKEMRNGVSDYLKKNPLDELMRFKTGSGAMKVYMKKVGETPVIKEILVFIEDVEKHNAVLISFVGNIDMGEQGATLTN